MVVDQNKPPRFCSQCGKAFPPPISANHSTKAVDKSVQGPKKLLSEKIFGNNKPSTDLNTPLDDKLSSTRPLSEKPPDDSLPIEESHEGRIDKHDKSFSDRSDDGKPPRKKPREYESPRKEPHGNKPPDDKPFSDKPTGIKPNDKSSTDKSPSEKPTHNPPSYKLFGDGSSGDKHDDDVPQRDNKVP